MWIKIKIHTGMNNSFILNVLIPADLRLFKDYSVSKNRKKEKKKKYPNWHLETFFLNSQHFNAISGAVNI